jgi:hypothetical protein
VTLLLTCVTPRFVVQASDRRLMYLDGSAPEEIANKATMLCRFAAFAHTGLARCSITEPTDELLLRCLAVPKVPISGLLDGLARQAARAIRIATSGDARAAARGPAYLVRGRGVSRHAASGAFRTATITG